MARSSGAARPLDWVRSVTSSTTQPIPSVEPQPFGREVVEPAPYEAVEREHIKAQYPDPEGDAGGVALGRPLRDVGADAGRAQGRIAPLHDLGDDAGVPRSAGRGDRAGDIGRKDRRQ